ncbi:hypothetical protein BJX68DRAFT_267510 [Aspergillus pseudodeflectus]|uniref:Fe2OG dioxygenase domain-containing protein n=1 Tax=Aspergillus pseudodeflectus TaxID=176178 RepID=A0ABR4K8M3_9EURO
MSERDPSSWNLEDARITQLPGDGEDAFYIADFITQDEEERLLQKITTAPLPTWKHLSHRRLQTYPSPLTNNNTLLASPLPSWLVSPIITPHFDRLALFAGSPHHAPNHVLVNEYTPGQGIMPHEDGAAYYPLVATVSLGGDIVLDLYEKYKRDDDEKNGHEDTGNNDDGDDSSSDKPITKEELVAKEGGGGRQPKYRILQERRSLLVTRNSIYRDYLHGIAERYRDEGLGPDSICNWDLLGHPERFRDGANVRETRISLTYRDVLKVAKLGNTMKFLNKR